MEHTVVEQVRSMFGLLEQIHVARTARLVDVGVSCNLQCLLYIDSLLQTALRALQCGILMIQKLG